VVIACTAGCLHTHIGVGDAIRLAEEGRPADGVTCTLVRCLIYVRISLDDRHDEHGVANQMATLERDAGGLERRGRDQRRTCNWSGRRPALST
jgi:hypothetical protein